MMYKNMLVAAVKSNGKVLREQGDTVFLPFGQEFTILVKNKNSLRCLVKIEIDGTDATENTSLIVPANGEVELERYIKNRNFESGNRFKFIERTASIENGPRGIKVDDGLIRVEFEFEREPQPIKMPRQIYNDPGRYWTDKYTLCSTDMLIGSPMRSVLGDVAKSAIVNQPLMNMSVNAASAAFDPSTSTETYFSSQLDGGSSHAEALPEPQAITGITVPGSVSDQKFVTGAWFPTDGVKHVMIMKLLGETAQGKPVKQAVTVKAKPKCVTCGHVNKATNRFCSSCGTSLILV